MSNNNTSTNIMESSTPKVKTTKRVPKKESAVVQVPSSTPSPVVTVPIVVTVPTVVTVPVAQAVVTPTVESQTPSTSLNEDFDFLVTQIQQWRDTATSVLRSVQRLQKRTLREIKEAGRRRRRRVVENGEKKEKRPTIFTTPVSLKDDLCCWLEKPIGFLMTPADVTRAFSAYIEKHSLKDADKGHTIHPDASMRRVLGLKEGDTLTYRNIQTYLYKLYNLPQRKNPLK